ncbi:hypothetical protein HCB69_15995 [Listeria booriae]|uniref:Uncharacterized protein n=1 Tax=Listeria booriae TaxID=1552123 RepID=A0A842FX24_9LIST|nr:hypothetical protein [Listeria booriae]MBC2285878.1 hypothetical protein [Listeria booriae]
MKSKVYIATITYRDKDVWQSFSIEVTAKNKRQARDRAWDYALFTKVIGFRSIYSVTAFKHKPGEYLISL